MNKFAKSGVLIKNAAFFISVIFLQACSSGEAPSKNDNGNNSPSPQNPDKNNISTYAINKSIEKIQVLNGRTMDAESADFDNDGDIDILLAMEFQQNILLINDGDADFTQAIDRLPTNQHDSEDIGLADFDGDGDIDAVIVSEDDQTNELYLNDGNARFTNEAARLNVEGISNAVAVHDFNNDGFSDILIGNNGQNIILINDGKANFNNETSTRLPQLFDATQDVELGDLDGDGDTDIVVANEDDNRILINDGSGHFTDESVARLTYRNVDEETREAALADVDGDGDLDLFFANIVFIKQRASAQNRLLLNNGSGIYSDHTSSHLPNDNDMSFDIEFVDIDNDNDLDALTANGLRNDSAYKIYINDGAGKFSFDQSKIFSDQVIGKGFDIELLDANGDGKIDLFLSGRNSKDILLIHE